MSNFSEFALDPKILRVLEELGYKTPTRIQDLAIPKVIAGCDLIASAQTGTGKTAAFILPILHMLATQPPQRGSPQILILVPTRELALQVTTEAQRFSKYLPQIKTVCVYGGVPYPPQRRALEGRYDILVATPGRLLDHMEQGRVDLSQLKLLVLDEADCMLDMGFIDPVEKIAAAAPKNRQTLLFSATIDKKILPVSRKLQKDPVEIRVEQDMTLKANIEQRLHYVDNIQHKIRILDHILETTEINQSIIFTSTKRLASELARQLQEKGYQSTALHGDMDQRQRTKTINRMRCGNVQFLVATDVAARGIDITSLSHVINFDLPRNTEDFIHRIGRTGRAGATGVAITFATYTEESLVLKINSMMGVPLNTHIIEGMEPKTKSQMRSPQHSSSSRSQHGERSSFGRPGRRRSRW